MIKSSGLRLALALTGFALFAACSSVPDPSPAEFLDFPTSGLLGKKRSAVERDLNPRGKSTSTGWVSYTPTFSVEYKDNLAVSVKEKRVPEDLTCKEAAQWMGFSRARTPQLKPGKCIWPTDDPRHGLGKKKTSATFDIEKRIFQAKLH